MGIAGWQARVGPGLTVGACGAVLLQPERRSRAGGLKRPSRAGGTLALPLRSAESQVRSRQVGRDSRVPLHPMPPTWSHDSGVAAPPNLSRSGTIIVKKPLPPWRLFFQGFYQDADS